MKTNYDIKKVAKEQIAPHMKTLVIIYLIYFLIVFINRYLKITYQEYPSSIFGFEYTAKKSISFGSYLLLPAFSLSINVIFLNLTRKIAPQTKDLFIGFKDWWSTVKLNFISTLFISLWFFVFIIPAFVKSYSYSMAPYILAENKGMRARDAIGYSRALMTGHKMELFMLDLSLIGYSLLNIVTLGVASIWVGPYLAAVRANFYCKLKGSKHKIKSIPIYDN